MPPAEPRPASHAARSASSISRKTSTLVPWHRSWRGEKRSRHSSIPYRSGSAVLPPLGMRSPAHDVLCLPLRQLLGEHGPDRFGVVVLWPGSPVAAHPLLPLSAGLRLREYPLLVDHRVELLAHAAVLGLRLDGVAVDDPPAVGVRTGAVTPRHRAGRLLPVSESTISNPHTRPSEPGPAPRCGRSLTPVPSGASRQFGDSGTSPSQ